MQKKTEDVISNKVSLINLFWEFFKIGLFTFGGGIAILPQLQRVVEKKGWMKPEETLDAIVLSQSLPGLIAVNVGTYVGFRMRGLRGAFFATLGVVLPAFFSIIVALALLDIVGNNRIVEGAFMGVKAAVCGLIIFTAVSLIRQMCRLDEHNTYKKKKGLCNRTAISVFNIAICLGSFVSVAFFGVAAVLVILIGMFAGIVYYRIANMHSREERK